MGAWTCKTCEISGQSWVRVTLDFFFKKEFSIEDNSETRRYEKIIDSQNVGLNMNFLINNILATKKQQKQHLHKKCDFDAKSTFWLFFTFFTFVGPTQENFQKIENFEIA